MVKFKPQELLYFRVGHKIIKDLHLKIIQLGSNNENSAMKLVILQNLKLLQRHKANPSLRFRTKPFSGVKDLVLGFKK